MPKEKAIEDVAVKERKLKWPTLNTTLWEKSSKLVLNLRKFMQTNNQKRGSSYLRKVASNLNKLDISPISMAKHIIANKRSNGYD